MYDVRRADGTHEREAVQVVAPIVEQSLATAEQRRGKADLHLVDEAGREVLPRNLCATGKRDIAAGRCVTRLLERRFDAVGNERERRAARKA